MYKISAPLNLNTLTEKNRDEVVNTLKKCKVQRVFLCGGLYFTVPGRYEMLEKLKEYAAFFKKNGFETGIWTSTVGHGIVLLHETKKKVQSKYDLVRTAQGNEISDTYCPYGESFRKDIADWVATLSGTGVDLVMLDDDFRMSQRSDGLGSITCCCDHHLKLMSELCSEPVTLETVQNFVLKGEKNKYRDAWMKVQGDGMRLLAKDIRAAVDKTNENVCIALCSAWCNWDIDGADALELAKILAGKNKPVLRLHGAPYWQRFGMYSSTTISVTELERMLFSFCKDRDVELFTEGDTYPRPRFNVPSAHLEVFDTMQRAQGEIDGILKYMFDYVAAPEYENGYAKAHLRNLPLDEALSKEFANSEGLGVRIYAYPHLLKKAEIPENSEEMLAITPTVSAAYLAENGIPTVYSGEGLCAGVFSYNALEVPLEAIKNGAVIDAKSAKILQNRGVDVGIEAVLGEVNIGVSRELYGQKIAPVNENCRILKLSLKEKAEPISTVKAGETETVTSYRYENANGQKFFVMCFDCAEVFHGMRLNYLRRESLRGAVEWISGKKLPAYCEQSPYVYTVIKKKGEKTLVALVNCFEDDVIEPTVKLDKCYSSVRFINGNGRLSDDTLILDAYVPAYKFVAFELE